MHEENTHKNIAYSLSPTYLMFFQILELKKLNCHFKKFKVFAKILKQGLSCSPGQGLGLTEWKNGKRMNASQCESGRRDKMWTNT